MAQPMSLWQWIRQTIRPHRGRLAVVAGIALIEAIIGNIAPLIWQRIVNDAVAGQTNWMLIVGLCVVSLLAAVPLIDIQYSLFAQNYRHTVKRTVFHWVLGLSPAWYRQQRTKILIERITKGAAATLSAVKALLVGDVLVEIGTAAVAIVIVGSYSTVGVIVITGFAAGYVWNNRRLGNKLSQQEEIVERADRELKARMLESLENIETMRTHHMTEREKHRFDMMAGTALTENIKSAWIKSWSDFFGRMSNVLPFMVAAVVFIPMLERKQIDVGTFFMLLMYTQRVVMPFGTISNMWMNWKQDEPRIRELLKIVAVRPTVTESSNPQAMQPLQKGIELRDVVFQYPDKGEPTILISHLEIPAGVTAAIVGETGTAGKTTLVNLLIRLFDVDEGNLTYDGIDVREISFRSLHRQVYYVAQKPQVFSGTIWDMLTYGLKSEEISQEEVINACRQAKADFAFDRGFLTEIGERATNLSGGECQRLSLARIFLRRPSVVILDEPTSALDPETERFVMDSLKAMKKVNPGMTFLIIAHRLSTIEEADQIICLEHGHVHAVGSHRDLLEKSIIYQQLCGQVAAS